MKSSIITRTLRVPGTRATHAALIPAALLILPAATFAAGVQERDSAGIHIVENASPAVGSRLDWRIGPEPSASIGVREGEEPYMLHNAFGATRLSDGRIVVANAGSSELRVFDGFGTHLVNWGGRGEGPGEFSGDLRQVRPWAGDSIIAWDFRSEEGLSVFGADGKFGRSFFLEREPGRFPSPVAVRTGGTILASAWAGDGEGIVDIRNGDGTLALSIGTFPMMEVYEYERPEGGRGSRDIAYGFVIATGFWGDLVFVAFTNRYEIKAFGADGRLARIVRRDHAPRATTQADVDYYVESQLSYYPDFTPDQVATYRQVFESTPLAKTFPAFSEAMGDAAGYLWVREYDFPGEPRPAPLWTVFDPGGRVLGFVETPNGLAILEIGEDYILGRTEDDLGVESIQLWPLERADGV